MVIYQPNFQAEATKEQSAKNLSQSYVPELIKIHQKMFAVKYSAVMP